MLPRLLTARNTAVRRADVRPPSSALPVKTLARGGRPRGQVREKVADDPAGVSYGARKFFCPIRGRLVAPLPVIREIAARERPAETLGVVSLVSSLANEATATTISAVAEGSSGTRRPSLLAKKAQVKGKPLFGTVGTVAEREVALGISLVSSKDKEATGVLTGAVKEVPCDAASCGTAPFS